MRISIMNAVVVMSLAIATAAGCGSADAPASKSSSSSSSGSGTSDETEPVGFSSFHPEGDAKSYFSGYDGTNEYVTPIAFFSADKPKVTIGDPSVAEVKGAILTLKKSLSEDVPAALDGKIQVIFVKSKKAGSTTIRAVAGSIDQTAKLTINAYGAGDVEVGKGRYNEGSGACNSCHQGLGVHSTSMLADLSDDTILGVAVDGKPITQIDAETGEPETVRPNSGDHKWQVTSAERKGLMAFLRSRPLTFQLPGAK